MTQICLRNRATVENGEHQALVQTRQADYTSIYGDILESKPVEIPAFETRPLEPIKLNNKKVLIPVLDGATGEYDLQRAFESAGFEVCQEIIHTDSFEAYQNSLSQLANAVQNAASLPSPWRLFRLCGWQRRWRDDPAAKAPTIFRACKRYATSGLYLWRRGGHGNSGGRGYFGDIKRLYLYSNKNNAYTHFMQDISIIKTATLATRISPTTPRRLVAGK